MCEGGRIYRYDRGRPQLVDLLRRLAHAAPQLSHMRQNFEHAHNRQFFHGKQAI